MKLIANGCSIVEGGESWTDWWLFTSMSQEEAEAVVEDQLGLFDHAGMPGGVYARRPVIRHSRSYTLIRQRCGLDI